MIRIFLLIPFLFLSVHVFAQRSFQVEGVVADTASALQLENAIVTVLQAKDSIFVDHTRADADGGFSFNGLDSGEYILVAIYPNYADFVERFTVSEENPSLDLGPINMLLLSELLDAVVITSRNKVTIKGDTIEFDASQFAVQKNARVEDLLKQLPGFQVDMNGNITALGETISKVLVDGEEFFGDDPTLVTRNIRADMVDKVQLYDKKSEQAEFTGIDDGEEVKTVNIQLREDSRHGTFGKVEAGVATEDLFEAQAMVNSFKGDQKVAAYGTIANNGKTDLGWQNSNRFLGMTPISINIGGSGSTADLDSYGGSYGGQGVPFARNGGGHFDTKWNNKKESINANYKVGDIDITGNRQTIDQNSLPTGILKGDAREDFETYAFRHKADVKYDWDIDSTSRLMLTIDGRSGNTSDHKDRQSMSLNGNDELLNQSEQRTRNDGNFQNVSMTAFWSKKLKKKGRTVSVRLRQLLDQNDGTGYLFSESEFYGDGGVVDSIQTVDQLKTTDRKSSTFMSNIAYSEPLSQFVKLGINYRLTATNSFSSLFSFDRAPDGGYTDIDSAFSNDFKLNQLTNEAGLTANYEKGKHVVSAGMEVSGVSYKQEDRFQRDVLARSFLNVNPRARWTYSLSNQRSLEMNYNGQTRQPSIRQIQPLRSNADPLNIALGNPDLKPSFRHSMRLNYKAYKQVSGTSFNSSVSANMADNNIISSIFTDEVGKSVYSYENLREKRPISFFGRIYYGTELTDTGLNFGGRIMYYGDTYYNRINGALNRTVSNRVLSSFELNQNKLDKYSFIFTVGPTYSASTSSLQEASSSRGWGLDTFLGFTVYLPAKFEIKSNNSYEYAQATQVFDEDFERLILNASVRKKFLKSESLILSIQANDILNQNIGFGRRTRSTGFTQTSYTTISRYFMFSLIWDFTTMGEKGN